ncbi:MAG: LysM peptidoglycan-binding domain-containing protein [Chloroflexota bacterium]
MHKITVLFLLALWLVGWFGQSAGEAADWPPESAYVSGVVGHAQERNLSCESRSAADFAAFFGVNASEAEILAYLGSSDNPNYGFVGNPDGTWGQIPPNSYGVHANPIENALVHFGLPVYGERNLTWDFVRSEIALGRPVIVWIIGAMWNGEPVEYTDSQGRKAIVARYEHTMILVGYDAASVSAVDAYDGVTKTFPVSSFLASWAVLENMGVYYRIDYTGHVYLPLTIRSVVDEATPPPPTDVPGFQTYIVQPGDTLRSIAEQFNTTWEYLAEINGIEYPYTIYPGQELLVPL